MIPVAEADVTTGVPALRALADVSIDGMVLLNLDGRCLYLNAAARGLFPDDARDLVGCDFVSLFPAAETDPLRAHVSSLRSGEATSWSSVLRDAVGSERALECRLQRSDGDESLLVGVVRDVGETRQLVRKTNAVARIAATMAYAGTVEATLHALARTLVEVTGLHACTIFLLGEDGKSNMAAIYGMPDDVLDRLRVIWSEGASPMSAAAIEQSETVVIHDVPRTLLQNPRFASINDYLRVAPWDTMVAVPLLYGDRPLGILSGHYTPGAPPGTADIAFLHTIAHQTTVAVENARLSAAAQERAWSEERKHGEEQAQEKDALYAAIFQSTSDALLIADQFGYVVEANPASCRMYGLSYDEAIAWSQPILSDRTMQQVRAMGVSEEVVDKSMDGSLLRLRTRTTALTYRGQPHFLLVGWDVTERVLAYELLEQRVEQRTHELETLLDVSQTVASTLQLRPLLDLILDQLKTVVDYDGSSIMEFDGQFLDLVRTSGPQVARGSTAFHFAVKNALPIWEVLAAGRPVIIDDIRADTPAAATFRHVNGISDSGNESPIRSWLAVPLMLKGAILGTLSCSHHEPHHYEAQHAKLAMAIARQAAVAMENARLYEQAQKTATLEERQRLARELHDSVSQALFGIGLGARTARTLLERDPVQAIESMDYVLSLTQAGMAEMRALIFELRPESLENEGLVGALEKQAAALRARHELLIDTVLCEEPEVSLPVKEALYRIAQEALHNAVKHADAGSARVSLRCTAGEVIITIEDDGRGFDRNASFPGHLGLHSMQERAARLGGVAEFDSEVGRGTRVRARIPLAESERS